MLPPTAAALLDGVDSTPSSRYSQRALSAAFSGHAWLDTLDLAHSFDAANAADATVAHREAIRLVSTSQEGSGTFLARLPDPTVSSSIIDSAAFLVMLQRRLGLYITALAPTLAARAAKGASITQHERLGDAAINTANNTTRHNVALYAIAGAMKAVVPPQSPPAPVQLCDRGDGSPASKADAKRRYAHLNANHVPDIARLLAIPQLYEFRCYTPYNQRVTIGQGDAPSTAEGHLYAFGGTLEKLIRRVFGLEETGDPSGPAYDRTLGTGHIAAYSGEYADALAKRHGVHLLLVESTGAIAPVLMALLRMLARAARAPGASDLSQYGSSRSSPKTFLMHHVANISASVQIADANTVLDAAATASLRLSLGYA